MSKLFGNSGETITTATPLYRELICDWINLKFGVASYAAGRSTA